MNHDLRNKVEIILNKKIKNYKNISGGCISSVLKIELEDGSLCLLKYNEHISSEMFIKEENGLNELQKAKAINIPSVIYASTNLIIMEYIINSKPNKDFFEDFGRRFANLHKYTSDKFGFYEDNYIGSTIQLNSFKSNWLEFYYENRLLFQFRLAEKNGYVVESTRKLFNKLEKQLSNIVYNDDPPCLLHGDLWSGNYITAQDGYVCLIDPAVYYGNREADLAMTKLFGIFDSRFYESYNEAFPLPQGYKERENIYKLYHLFNHLNIFGRGYLDQTIDCMKYYL